MSEPRWNWRVVLVRPRNPLNIGAAARACANFGFRELVVVNPYEPTWQETRSAVGAEEVLRSARAVPTLNEAIGDAALVIGTTSGSRRQLVHDLVPLTNLLAWLETRAATGAGNAPAKRRGTRTNEAESPRGPREGPIVRNPRGGRVLRAAILFGSEKTGLSNEEMSHCQALVRIPTSPGCPSMNLGQSVAVCCYELRRLGLVSTRAPGARVHRSDPVVMQSLLHLFERAVRVLDAVGYLQPKSRPATLVKLRQWLLDLGLTNYEAKILGGILAQIEWKLGLAAGRNPSSPFHGQLMSRA